MLPRRKIRENLVGGKSIKGNQGTSVQFSSLSQYFTNEYEATKI
jgi:hypothetical protein